MSTTVTLPLWLAALLVGFTLLWLLQHFAWPSARWYFRRRAAQLLDELDQRLALKLPSFKLTRREVLVDRLRFNPEVLQLVDRLAEERGVPRRLLMQEVSRYAREIVPAFNAVLYFTAATRVARRLLHTLYRVRLGHADDTALASLEPASSVVFLMNHRSNMDYILATYLAAERTALSYAVGEWARVWPLQQLIRAMGGYFVRRDSSDELYRGVLQCYVQMAAQAGVPQAVFPEGRLSRDGALAAARLGLLSYIVRGFDPHAPGDVVFIPVGINYDRVFEDRSLLREHDGEAVRSRWFTLRTTSTFVAKQLWRGLRGKHFRNGYACVNFGQPVSLRQWLAEHASAIGSRDQAIQPLAEHLMQRIGSIVPILPVALVATVIRHYSPMPLTPNELRERGLGLLEKLRRAGMRAYIPRDDPAYMIEVGIRQLRLRRVLIENGCDALIVAPKERGLIDYYARSIAPLTAAAGGVAALTFRSSVHADSMVL